MLTEYSEQSTVSSIINYMTVLRNFKNCHILIELITELILVFKIY